MVDLSTQELSEIRSSTKNLMLREDIQQFQTRGRVTAGFRRRLKQELESRGAKETTMSLRDTRQQGKVIIKRPVNTGSIQEGQRAAAITKEKQLKQIQEKAKATGETQLLKQDGRVYTIEPSGKFETRGSTYGKEYKAADIIPEGGFKTTEQKEEAVRKLKFIQRKKDIEEELKKRRTQKLQLQLQEARERFTTYDKPIQEEPIKQIQSKQTVIEKQSRKERFITKAKEVSYSTLGIESPEQLEHARQNIISVGKYYLSSKERARVAKETGMSYSQELVTEGIITGVNYLIGGKLLGAAFRGGFKLGSSTISKFTRVTNVLTKIGSSKLGKASAKGIGIGLKVVTSPKVAGVVLGLDVAGTYISEGKEAAGKVLVRDVAAYTGLSLGLSSAKGGRIEPLTERGDIKVRGTQTISEDITTRGGQFDIQQNIPSRPKIATELQFKEGATDVNLKIEDGNIIETRKGKYATEVITDRIKPSKESIIKISGEDLTFRRQKPIVIDQSTIIQRGVSTGQFDIQPIKLDRGVRLERGRGTTLIELEQPAFAAPSKSRIKVSGITKGITEDIISIQPTKIKIGSTRFKGQFETTPFEISGVRLTQPSKTRVSPEDFAKRLETRGKLELIEGYDMKQLDAQGVFFRTSKGKPTIAVARDLPQGYRQSVYAHELIHLKTPKLVLDASRILPYRIRPSEVIAFSLQDSVAKIGFKIDAPTISPIPSGQIVTPLGITPTERIISQSIGDEDIIKRSLTEIGEVSQQRKIRGQREFEFSISTPKGRFKKEVIRFAKDERGELLLSRPQSKTTQIFETTIEPIKGIEFGDESIPLLRRKNIYQLPIVSIVPEKDIAPIGGTKLNGKIQPIIKQSTSISPILKPRITIDTSITPVIKPETTIKPIQLPAQAQRSKATTLQQQIGTFLTPAPTPFTPIGGIVPPPRSLKITIPKLEFGKTKPQKKKKKGKRETLTGFAPSITAIFLGITGKRQRAGEISGLGIRPVGTKAFLKVRK